MGGKLPSDRLLKAAEFLRLAGLELSAALGSLDDVQDELWGPDVDLLAQRVSLIEEELEDLTYEF